MKLKLLFTSTALLICVLSSAQHGKIYTRKPYTPEQLAQRKAIPIWQIPSKDIRMRSVENLPKSVNNATLPFMPPVFEQRSNSCSQAAGIRYVFTYEVNRMLNRESVGKDRLFSYLYTWNYLNEGEEEGSYPDLGYNIAKVTGVPTLDVFNDNAYFSNYTKWMTGYDKYISAMKYRVKDVVQFPLKTEEGISLLKQYLYDKGEDGQSGGIVVFSCYSSDWRMRSYSGTSTTGLNNIIVRNGTDGAHALTIVGYDDDVEYDLNGDDIISNDERGAFIFVNSWGTWWGSKGYAYYPYKLFLLDPSEGGLEGLDANALGISVEEHTPFIIFKADITYDNRNDLRFELGVYDGASDNSRSYTLSYPIMMYQGGDYPMQGYSSDDSVKNIKVALNFTDMLDKYTDFKEPVYTLEIRRTAVGESVGTGTLNSFCVEDLRTNKTYVGNKENVPLTGGKIFVSTYFAPTKDVSMNREEWRAEDGTPSAAPFIIRRVNGKQVKVQFINEGDSVTIKYFPLQ